eukprot:8119399-Alexandrium_andersonii.AAC.1
MSASLVGSEMCIRDSPLLGGLPPPWTTPDKRLQHPAPEALFVGDSRAVSYTHLTLPTICSV